MYRKKNIERKKRMSGVINNQSPKLLSNGTTQHPQIYRQLWCIVEFKHTSMKCAVTVYTKLSLKVCLSDFSHNIKPPIFA